MLTTFKSLPSASELPIIVAMKIGFGIGAEQDGEQSPRQHCSVNPMLSWTPRGPVSSYASPTKNPADKSLCRGAGACPHFGSRAQSRGCARFSAADRRHPSAITHSMPAVASSLRPELQPTSPLTSPAPEKRVETAQCFGISNRFWPQNRSYRKQAIKPCLTGARTAQCNSSELPSFIGQPLRRNR
jgi:hypothetical protein